MAHQVKPVVGPVVAEPPQPAARGRASWRFSKYTMLSFITVPVGYTVLLVARHLWDVNAGLLNLAVGTVLTPPSFLLYRSVVWPERSGKGWPAELFTFWQAVMVGAIVSSVLIAAVDAVSVNNGVLIVAAGLLGQGVVFIGRFFWLDRVTFSAGSSEPGGPSAPRPAKF